MKPAIRLRAILLTAILTAPVVLAANFAVAADTIALGVGAQRIIVVPGPVARIVIAEPGVVSASVLNDHEVAVSGLKGGNTALTIFSVNNPGEGLAYLVNVDGGNRKTGAAQPSSGGGLTKALQSDPDLKGVQATTFGDNVVISGSVPSLEAHGRAAGLVKALGGKQTVEDLTSVTGNQMVAVEIKFAAVSVTTLNELGFNFQQLGSNIQGATTAPSTVPSATGGAGGLSFPGGVSLPLQSAFNLFLNSSKNSSFATLSVLSGTGLVQLLAEPTLLVRSGEHASFLAGGEVPIPVPQGGSATGAITIEYHPYGVRLEVEPVVLSDRRIALKVAPEVSEIDNSNNLSFDGFSVPAFLRRSTSTMVELGDGQSFVIAGLIYSNNSLTENKVPWLGDIPVLGAFFKATRDSRERQELVVIATPHLVHPLDSKALPPLPGQAISEFAPTFSDALTNAKPLDRAVVEYGLIR
jgi:pilus assembly protein CpaC